MKNRLSFAAVLFTLTFPASANEGVDLATRSKSMVGTSAPAPNASAPFAASHDPLAGIFLREEQDRRGPSGTCEAAARDLCYDLAAGRVTYPGARRYMPQLGSGLAADSVSVRRDAIVLRYTFK